MKESTEVVRTAEGDEWQYTCLLPESISEATEIYGEDGALYLHNSGLKVKEQNVARELYRNGKSAEEVNAAVAAYRPGQGTRVSAKKQALELIVSHSDMLRDNVDLLDKVQTAFVNGKFKDVVELLG